MAIVRSTNDVSLEDVLLGVSVIFNLTLFNLLIIYTFRSFKFGNYIFVLINFSAQGCRSVGRQVIYHSTDDKKLKHCFLYIKINREIPKNNSFINNVYT